MNLSAFFSFIWSIFTTVLKDDFMESDLSLLVYFAIVVFMICYMINFVRSMRKF